MKRSGFTIVELLVSIIIISLLLALLVPAIQVAREAARNTQCKSNLNQIGLALQNYESAFGMLPACSVKRLSWHVSILPQIDQAMLFQQVTYSSSDPAQEIRGVRVPVYLCPSESAPDVTGGDQQVAAANYLGNSGTGVLTAGYNGVFQHFHNAIAETPEGPVRLADISDGLSVTAAASEVLHSTGFSSKERLRIVWNTPSSFDRPDASGFLNSCSSIPSDPSSEGWLGSPIARGWQWTRGEIGYSTYNHMLTPMLPSCFNGIDVQTGIFTAASHHRAGVNVLYCDAHVQFVSSTVHNAVWGRIGSRNGSESINP